MLSLLMEKVGQAKSTQAAQQLYSSESDAHSYHRCSYRCILVWSVLSRGNGCVLYVHRGTACPSWCYLSNELFHHANELFHHANELFHHTIEVGTVLHVGQNHDAPGVPFSRSKSSACKTFRMLPSFFSSIALHVSRSDPVHSINRAVFTCPSA